MTHPLLSFRPDFPFFG